MTDHDTIEVFRWFGRKDLCDSIFWHDRTEAMELRVLVNCSDMFWWATSDAEVVTAEDIPELERAWEDLHDDQFSQVYAPELWIARKRGMRPQTPWWQRDALTQRARDLFLAAGPVRDRKDEG